jgi:hypothetical protein
MRCLLGMVQGYAPLHTPAAASNTGSKGSSTSPGRGAAAGQAASPPQQQQAPAAPRPSAGVVVMRQLEAAQLLPSAEQLHLVDKKFGGACVQACGQVLLQPAVLPSGAAGVQQTFCD